MIYIYIYNLYKTNNTYDIWVGLKRGIFPPSWSITKCQVKLAIPSCRMRQSWRRLQTICSSRGPILSEGGGGCDWISVPSALLKDGKPGVAPKKNKWILLDFHQRMIKYVGIFYADFFPLVLGSVAALTQHEFAGIGATEGAKGTESDILNHPQPSSIIFLNHRQLQKDHASKGRCWRFISTITHDGIPKVELATSSQPKSASHWKNDRFWQVNDHGWGIRDGFV